MKKKLFAVPVLFALMTLETQAQWSANSTVNTSVSVVTNDQRVPNMISDGAGGVIIVWNDSRNGTDYDIYAQHLNAAGVAQWVTNGVAVCTATSDQTSVKIVSDGANGAIISWQDYRSGTDDDIYAQRINGSGIVQWATNGVAVCTASNDQYFSKFQNRSVVSDGANGAIFTWQDFRNGSDFDIYAQRINGSGIVQWTTNGVAICAQANDQDLPVLTSDASNGAIITWQDFRSGSDYDTYVQRINGTGATQWTANGVALCTLPGDQTEPALTLSGAGGAIISWADYRNGFNNDIYAQQVNNLGLAQWTTNGVVICNAADEQNTVSMDSDGSNGAVIVWNDLRSGSDFDIYTQRIDNAGTVQWTSNGVAICATSNDQYVPTLISNGSGGATITWNDFRNGTDIDIYAQQINATGLVQWASNGIAVANASGDNDVPVIVSDGSGGTIISWSDYRSGTDIDVYAQNICTAGLLAGAPIAPATISGSTTICSGTSNSYSVVPVSGATSYSWSVPGGWTGTSTTNVIALTAGTNGGTISVMALNACGSSSVSLQTLTVITAPAAPTAVSGNTSICSGTSNTYSIAPVNGATSYSWVAPLGWTGASTSNSISLTANTFGGTMSVTAINGCGASPMLLQTIAVKPLPNITTTLTAGKVITSNQTGATYQWLNCANGSSITSANGQSYTATATGSYAVVVNLNGCSGTSSCVSVTLFTGITEFGDNKQPAIYPVPNDGSFFVQATEQGAYSIVNELGQIIRSFELTALNQYTVHLEHFEKGIYFMLGSNNNTITRQKIIVAK